MPSSSCRALHSTCTAPDKIRSFLEVRDAGSPHAPQGWQYSQVLRAAGQDTCSTAGLRGTGSPKACQFSSADSTVGLLLPCSATQHYQVHTQSALTKAHRDVCHIQNLRVATSHAAVLQGEARFGPPHWPAINCLNTKGKVLAAPTTSLHQKIRGQAVGRGTDQPPPERRGARCG